jgi:hypothetical protein
MSCRTGAVTRSASPRSHERFPSDTWDSPAGEGAWHMSAERQRVPSPNSALAVEPGLSSGDLLTSMPFRWFGRIESTISSALDRASQAVSLARCGMSAMEDPDKRAIDAVCLPPDGQGCQDLLTTAQEALQPSLVRHDQSTSCGSKFGGGFPYICS